MRIAKTAALIVFALALIAGGVAWFWHQASPDNARMSATVRVSVVLSTETGNLAAEDVHVLEVQWRGLMFTFKKSMNDTSRDTDGAWEASVRVSDVDAWQSQYPVTTEAKVHLRGMGFAKLEGKQGITRGTLASPDHLKLHIRIATATNQARLVLVDGANMPVGPATLHLSLQYRVEGRGQMEGREVKVGNDGRAVVGRIEFPLTVYVASCEDVDETEFLITPDMHRPVTLDDGSTVLVVRKRRIRSQRLAIHDAAIRRQLVEAAQREELLFALFPMDPPSAPFRPVWSLLEHSLDSNSCERLLKDGQVWLGELPECRFWLSIFTRDGISASMPLPPPAHWDGEFPLKLKQAAVPVVTRRLTKTDGQPVSKAWVFVGIHPHFLLPRISEIAARARNGQGAQPSHFGMSGSDGSVTLCGDCEYYTVLTEDYRVFHVRNAAETLALADSAEDGVATVKVVSKDGKPMAGVAINFTSTDTSHDDSYAAWPLGHELCDWWVTNSAGIVEIRGLLPMTYVLSVAHVSESAKGRHFSIDASSVKVVRMDPGKASLMVTAGDALVEECERCKEHGHRHGDKHSGD